MPLPTTFAEMLAFDRDTVALNLSECGLIVTQYPLGVMADAATVTVIIGGKGRPQDDRSRGKDNVRMLEIWCSDSVAMNAKDQWVVQDELYQVVAWDNDLGDWNHITLKIMENTLRTGAGHVIGGM